MRWGVTRWVKFWVRATRWSSFSRSWQRSRERWFKSIDDANEAMWRSIREEARKKDAEERAYRANIAVIADAIRNGSWGPK